jgi:hypothetical protein
MAVTQGSDANLRDDNSGRLSAIASYASQASLATVHDTWSGVRPHLGGQDARRRPVRLSLAHQYDHRSHLPGGFGPMGGSGGLPCTFSSRKPGSSQVSRSRPHQDTSQLPPDTTVTPHHAPARPAHRPHPKPPQRITHRRDQMATAAPITSRRAGRVLADAELVSSPLPGPICHEAPSICTGVACETSHKTFPRKRLDPPRPSP